MIKINKQYSLAVLSIAIASFLSGGYLIDKNSIMHKENKVLPPKDAGEISDKVLENKQLSHLNINGISTTNVQGLYLVVSDQTTFYYSPETNSVINGVLFNAESGNDETAIMKEIVLQQAKLNGSYSQEKSSSEATDRAISGQESRLNQSVNSSSRLGEKALKELKEKIEGTSEKVDYSNMSFKEKDLHESASIEKYNLDGRINPKDIKRFRTHVSLKGKSFARIGFDKDGKKLDEQVEKEQIKALIKNIKSKSKEWTVTYEAPEEKYSIVAFTDPTCPFCQKLHKAIPELNKNGITVHYLFYPRTMQLGLDDSRLKSTLSLMDSIWYSSNKKEAMDDVYAGYRPREKEVNQNIKNPVFEHYLVGEFVNVSGTPTILMDNGNRLGGFGTAKALMRKIVEK